MCSLNYNDLSEKIDILFDDEEKLREMSVNALKTVDNKLQISEMIKGFTEAIEYSRGIQNEIIYKKDE